MASAATDQRTADLRRERYKSTEPIVVAPESDGAKPRYHAFDALRGIAMFLVIGLHAALGYVERDIPGVLWCTRDAPTFLAFDWFCWWTMGASNPLYFTIAGFFAVSLYNSHGIRGFFTNRARRVAVPLVVGIFTILPLCLATWMYGWLVSERCTWRQIRKLTFKDPLIQSERFGTGHLWFLQYLIVMLVAYALLRWWVDRRGGKVVRLRRGMDFLLESSWRPLFLAVPTTAFLWISHHRVGIDAALDRHNSFVINPIKLLHYAAFFIIGMGLYHFRQDLARLTRSGPLYLVLSVPVFVCRALLLGQDRITPLHGTPELALAFTGALFSWLAVFGSIGLALRFCRRSQPVILYLADSSYWIYLVHMPFLGLIQVDLYLIPGHALWKFPIVLIGTLALGFASYHTLVRYSPIGTGLHGRRLRPASQGVD